MLQLILGLLIFLGVHSARVFADDFRTRFIAQHGLNTWKLAYTAASLPGFVLLVHGYGAVRADSASLYVPPHWLYHLTALLMWVSFILIAAAHVRGNRIKARLGHPMVAGVKAWSLAHLLSNGRIADVLLFGAFLAWAVVDFVSARRRDRAAGITYPPAGGSRDVVVLAAGTMAYLVFALWLHRWWIGVDPRAG